MRAISSAQKVSTGLSVVRGAGAEAPAAASRWDVTASRAPAPCDTDELVAFEVDARAGDAEAGAEATIGRFPDETYPNVAGATGASATTRR